MESFVGIEASFSKLERELGEKRLSSNASVWTAEESRAGRRERRIADSMADFWTFDKTYFPPELHSSYSAPCDMHKDLLAYFLHAGVDVVLAPREHAKTVYAKKMLIWLLLSGRHTFSGIYCETLPKAENWLQDIVDQLRSNPRIASDFDLAFTKDASDQLEFKVQPSTPIVGDGKLRIIACYGGGRSVKGSSRNMQRPSLLICDDIESLQSSLTDEAVRMRGKRLSENVSSLQHDVGSVIVLGNNFDARCALNVLKKEAEEGLLPDKWRVHVFKAWANNKPLWKARYPVKTEQEFRALLSLRNESEYQSNYQQNPIPDTGFIFLEEFYQEYDHLPADAAGLMYVDPNLSKKSKGDTTAATAAAYSPKEGCIYVVDALCESFSGSNDLLAKTNNLFRKWRKLISVFGMDGNVNQESTWTNNVRNYEIISGLPFPRIIYKHYDVDNLAKNAQLMWVEGKVKFPRGFGLTKTGKEYLSQVFGFVGKKKNNKDDAPDSLICAIELMHERRIIRRASTQSRFSIITPDRL